MTLLARTPSKPSSRTYEIHEVAQLTGLAAARLRAWERRYEVVRPRRMPNGYRVYTSEQVALLRAYAHLIGAGDRIGELATRPREEVLARAHASRPDPSPLGALLDALREFDRERLAMLVAEQLALRGLHGFAQQVALPLGQSLDRLTETGDMPVLGKPLAVEVVVHALKGGLRLHRGTGPLLVCGCIAGDHQEWEFLCALTAAQEKRWRIEYLGADLPVDPVAEAAWKLAPRAVALSGNDPSIVRANLPALAALPAQLPPDTLAVIDGRGAEAHAVALRNYGYRLGLGVLDRRSG